MIWNTIRSAMGPWGIVPFGDHMPDNSLGDMNALAKAHAAARAQRLAAGHTGSLIGPPAPPAPAPPISQSNYTPSSFGAANSALGMTPQEQALYQRHLTNLNGPGGVDNPDGSRSTLYQSVERHNGRYYNVPTVWNGKIETEKWTRPRDGKVFDIPNATARANIDKAGWDSFPSYASPDEADARYEKMHGFMEKDTAAYHAAHPTPAAPQMPWWASGDMTKMFPGAAAPAAPTAIAAPVVQGPAQEAPVPMPQARPAEAPQAQPDTSFFMRNALSMRDPSTGEMIDPSGAASVRGPDLISKMMTYLHNKA